MNTGTRPAYWPPGGHQHLALSSQHQHQQSRAEQFLNPAAASTLTLPRCLLILRCGATLVAAFALLMYIQIDREAEWSVTYFRRADDHP